MSINNELGGGEDVEFHITLKMHSSIAKLLKIFANAHGEGSTEDRRIDNFVTEEIVQTVKALAAEPFLSEEYPDSLKELIKRLLKEATTNITKTKTKTNINNSLDLDLDLK
jgi:hypothetical protein